MIRNVANINYANAANFSLDKLSNLVEFAIIPPSVIGTEPADGYSYVPARKNGNLDSAAFYFIFDSKMFKQSINAERSVTIYNSADKADTKAFSNSWQQGLNPNFMHDTLVLQVNTALSGLTKYTIEIDTKMTDGLLIPMENPVYLNFTTIARADEQYNYSEYDDTFVLPANDFASDYFTDILQYAEFDTEDKALTDIADSAAAINNNVSVGAGVYYHRKFVVRYYDGSKWVDYFDRNSDSTPDNLLPDTRTQVVFSYPDANNDGIVDNASLNENYLLVYRLNKAAQRWQLIRNSKKDTAKNIIYANIDYSGIFTVMAEVPPTLKLSVTPDSITANAADTMVVTATVTDNNSDPVSGDLIQFTLHNGNGKLSDTLVITDSTGKAAIIYTADSVVNYITISALDKTPVMPDAIDTVVFYQHPGPPDSIWINQTADTITDSGKDTVVLGFTLYDKFLNRIYSEKLHAEVEGMPHYDGVLSDTDLITDSDGYASVTYYSTVYDGIKYVNVYSARDTDIANTASIVIKDVLPPVATVIYPSNLSDTVMLSDSIIIAFNDLMDTRNFEKYCDLSAKNGTVPISIQWQRSMEQNMDTLFVIPSTQLSSLSRYIFTIKQKGAAYPTDASAQKNQLHNLELNFKTVYYSGEAGKFGISGVIELDVPANVMPYKYSYVVVYDYTKMSDARKKKINDAQKKLIYNVRVVPEHVFDYELEAHYYDTAAKKYALGFADLNSDGTHKTLFKPPYATLKIYYKDDNNDGIEDRAKVNVNSLKLYTLNESSLSFEELKSKVNREGKYIYAVTKHLSIYTLLSAAPPENMKLYQNYPNPFNPRHEETTITFDLSADALLTVDVFDITGTRIKRLVDGEHRTAAHYEDLKWDGTNESGKTVASGLYILRFEAQSVKTGKYIKFIKVVVLK